MSAMSLRVSHNGHTSNSANLEACANLGGQFPLCTGQDNVNELLRCRHRRNLLPRCLHFDNGCFTAELLRGRRKQGDLVRRGAVFNFQRILKLFGRIGYMIFRSEVAKSSAPPTHSSFSGQSTNFRQRSEGSSITRAWLRQVAASRKKFCFVTDVTQ